MFPPIDNLTLIERADLAQRLARDQMSDAVELLLQSRGYSPERAVKELGTVYRIHGRIPAIKEARRFLALDLLHAKCVIDSLADRYGAHFTHPQREVA